MPMKLAPPRGKSQAPPREKTRKKARRGQTEAHQKKPVPYFGRSRRHFPGELHVHQRRSRKRGNARTRFTTRKSPSPISISPISCAPYCGVQTKQSGSAGRERQPSRQPARPALSTPRRPRHAVALAVAGARDRTQEPRRREQHGRRRNQVARLGYGRRRLTPPAPRVLHPSPGSPSNPPTRRGRPSWGRRGCHSGVAPSRGTRLYRT